MKITRIHSEEMNSIIAILTLVFSIVAIIISYKSYNLSNLKPKFELGVISHDGYQMEWKYKIIKNNEETNIDLYGSRKKYEYSINKNSDDIFVVDNTKPTSLIHFYIKNIGDVSAENTKIIFEFNGMSLNVANIENNIDESPLADYHFVWEYKPVYPILEDSYCELHWVDKDIMYPDINKEFGYSFSESRIYDKKPYIDIKIVSKTSVIHRMKINVNYHNIEDYGKNYR